MRQPRSGILIMDCILHLSSRDRFDVFSQNVSCKTAGILSILCYLFSIFDSKQIHNPLRVVRQNNPRRSWSRFERLNANYSRLKKGHRLLGGTGISTVLNYHKRLCDITRILDASRTLSLSGFIWQKWTLVSFFSRLQVKSARRAFQLRRWNVQAGCEISFLNA